MLRVRCCERKAVERVGGGTAGAGAGGRGGARRGEGTCADARRADACVGVLRWPHATDRRLHGHWELVDGCVEVLEVVVNGAVRELPSPTKPTKGRGQHQTGSPQQDPESDEDHEPLSQGMHRRAHLAEHADVVREA